MMQPAEADERNYASSLEQLRMKRGRLNDKQVIVIDLAKRT
ncbi:MAG: hypothetical protein ACT6R2_00870 [Blastomonas fulva]|jgi:hypothetical protein